MMPSLAQFFCGTTAGCTGDAIYGGHILACPKFDAGDYGFHSRASYEARQVERVAETLRLEVCPRCSNVACGLLSAPMREIGKACEVCGCDTPTSEIPRESIPGVRFVALRPDEPSWTHLPKGHFDPMVARSFPPDLSKVLRQRAVLYQQTLAIELTNAVHRELPEAQLVLLPPTNPRQKAS